MKYLLFLLILFLNACSAQKEEIGLTPMPHFEEPDDAALHVQMRHYLTNEMAPLNSQYDMMRVDLNNDKKRDALVLMKLPHTYWCDWGGCPLLIFKAHGNRFKFISRTENVRGPVFVSRAATQTNWRKIIIRASGSHTKDRNVVLRFNGLSYPKNTFGAPTFEGQPHSRIMDKFFR